MPQSARSLSGSAGQTVFFAVQIPPQSADIDAPHTHDTAPPTDILIIDIHNAAFVYFEMFELTFVRGGGLEYVQIRGTGEHGSAEDDMPCLPLLGERQHQQGRQGVVLWQYGRELLMHGDLGMGAWKSEHLSLWREHKGGV